MLRLTVDEVSTSRSVGTVSSVRRVDPLLFTPPVQVALQFGFHRIDVHRESERIPQEGWVRVWACKTQILCLTFHSVHSLL